MSAAVQRRIVELEDVVVNLLTNPGYTGGQLADILRSLTDSQLRVVIATLRSSRGVPRRVIGLAVAIEQHDAPTQRAYANGVRG